MATPVECSLITTDIDFAAHGYQAGHLRLPYSHDRSGYGAFPIPIAVRQDGEGPTLLLTGGNHGDEYEGPIALMKLMRRLPELQIHGRVIVIPGLNFPALVHGRRTSPIDGGNLNRAFPGRRNGSPTEMIAHYVESMILPLTDVAFDIHAGGASTNYLPTLLAALPQKREQISRYRRLVDAIGAPRTLVMDLLGEDRTFAAAARRHDVAFLCAELGGHATCNLDGLEIAEAGIERLMVATGLLRSTVRNRAPAPTRLIKVHGADHYVFSPVAGIFEPAHRLGEAVRPGQIAGWIHDPWHPEEPARAVHFKRQGFVICTRALATVEPGDCLAHLAEDCDWERELAA